MKTYKIFTINPGATSTKIALFENERAVFTSVVNHDAEKLKTFSEISDQFDYRKEIILDEMKKQNINLEGVDAFVGRGGGLVSIAGGIYTINDKMIEHLRMGITVKHPANLGPQLARYFATQYHAKCYVVSPPDTDEFTDLARVTGWKGVYRASKLHALNQKEVGIRYAKSLGKKYSDVNLIICHIGGGTSVTAHEKGKMIDSNDIAHGDGPMAPTRSGALPVVDVIKLCFSGKYTEKEVYERTTKTGGLVDHLGTSDVREVQARIERGDRYAKLIYDAMIYQIGKYVGSMAAVLKGNVDGIVLTGGITYDQYLVEKLSDMIGFIAPISVMVGEFEMEAMAAGALRVLNGEEETKEYSGEPLWDGFEELK